MKRFALLGHDIGYSLSPVIHNMIYKRFGLEARYEIVDAEPERLASVMRTLAAEYDGFNVTKPYKMAVVKYLKENRADCGSVNTVVNRGGALYGYNTDGEGFTKHFTEHFDPKGRDVLVLGAGGVAQIIVPALIRLGANVSVLNRSAENAQALCDRTGAAIYTSETPELIVNCTSCGLRPGENPLPESVDLSRLIGAYDTIYAPPETDFLRRCRKQGVLAVNGLGMLVRQAMRACEYMCELHCDDTLYKKIVKRLSKRG